MIFKETPFFNLQAIAIIPGFSQFKNSKLIVITKIWIRV